MAKIRKTRSSKIQYLAARKKELVETNGCKKCGAGKALPAFLGFEKYWCEHILGAEIPYDARRFVFKYTDPTESDVPVAQLPKYRETTKKSIDAALARCVILCRSCADPRRTRKDDQCRQEQVTSD